MYAKTTVTLALAFLASSAVAQTNATAAYIATLDIGTKSTSLPYRSQLLLLSILHINCPQLILY